MGFGTQDLVEGIRASRRHFWKHLDGLTPEQWDWKPYAECKSVRETLGHLLADDHAALFALETNQEPDYEALYGAEPEKDIEKLRVLLAESHETLCSYILAHYGDAPMDTVVCIYGEKMPLGVGVSHLSSEDFYHAGQIGFIRMATDPTWDYYATIYGHGA